MTALYLDAATATRVVLDGRGLRVKARQSADRLFPVTRLSQVVVCGYVDWSTDALLACAQAGITVTFLHRGGKIRAMVSGASGVNDWMGLHSLLTEFLERDDGLQLYRQWMHLRARQARKACIDTLRHDIPWRDGPDGLRYVNYRLRNIARASDLRLFDMRFRSLLTVKLEEFLSDLQIDTRDLLFQQHGITLAADLANILIWPTQAAKVSWIRKQIRRQWNAGAAHEKLGWHDAVALLEKQGRSVEKNFHQIFREFQRFLAESVTCYVKQ